ncbi:16S rRNA (cytosine(1402)-N(4))-methyltransferase RsmH [Patescibacteria group bacterium]|nr:16S rRNA (cytosine(1402)-N(4))-methyltransferase RsmH [Patescibacteria group bacterium]MBU1500983.1 16S rRNA (cytosine(1402)-N(4))-methyltransferase RsmH [Patescibacteria group bacterium]MBU2080613.1 16S rRNA (cytosine(1402)-N(4))-methyltransferase RsmH [Patescibacteria group bacterium]MBU2124312.1 16S rRNA (cytosine(1402)-N(4))-methyltransferase RsmH [Patescibacteria group bacterium]MBU2194438.1 16S rRNA (cytosine(1402)-N(4))-methyltransferase RsmH [Patescibacteria group bacterium]
MEVRHDTVLLQESVDALSLHADDVVVDATLGGAGHFRLLLETLGKEGTLVGIDADAEALVRAQAVVNEVPEGKRPDVRLVNGNFRDLAEIMDEQKLTPTKVLFDLGWSGFQLANGRGFSFRADEPLHMTYGDPETATTAGDLVNHLSEESLADLLWSLGEERFARKIAKSIVDIREESEITTTHELVAAIEAGVPTWYTHRRLHPATKTFQALRIAANDELGAIREGVGAALERVPEGGRIAVITFHSIEDRIVKNMFRDAAQAGQGTLVSRKPQVPSPEETKANPRARSAKLRVFEVGTTAPKKSINLHSFPVYA